MFEFRTMPGHLIRRLNQISVSLFSERATASGYDVTPVQFASLSTIASNPGLDQASLAGLIAYDRVTIGGVIDRLVTKGFVKRITSKRDRRARELHLTKDGNQALAVLDPLVRAIQPEIIAGLSPSEQQEFTRLLKKAADAGNGMSRAPLKIVN